MGHSSALDTASRLSEFTAFAIDTSSWRGSCAHSSGVPGLKSSSIGRLEYGFKASDVLSLAPYRPEAVNSALSCAAAMRRTSCLTTKQTTCSKNYHITGMAVVSSFSYYLFFHFGHTSVGRKFGCASHQEIVPSSSTIFYHALSSSKIIPITTSIPSCIVSLQPFTIVRRRIKLQPHDMQKGGHEVKQHIPSPLLLQSIGECFHVSSAHKLQSAVQHYQIFAHRFIVCNMPIDYICTHIGIASSIITFEASGIVETSSALFIIFFVVATAFFSCMVMGMIILCVKSLPTKLSDLSRHNTIIITAIEIDEKVDGLITSLKLIKLKQNCIRIKAELSFSDKGGGESFIVLLNLLLSCETRLLLLVRLSDLLAREWAVAPLRADIKSLRAEMGLFRL